jgi:P27 family predicted phage terminase small subunit
MARKLNLVGDYGMGTDGTGLEPPRPLEEYGRKLWDRIQREYRIADAGGQEILCQACQALDRAENLADVIKTEGPMLQTRNTRRTHPAVREELQARAFVVRALKELGLAVEPIKPIGHPPQRSWPEIG